MTDLGKAWLKDLEAIDCRYFVIKAEDLFEALNENMLREFSDMLYYYNEYREQQGKSVNKYLVLNRDEYPQFKSSKEFINWVNNKVKTRWEYRIINVHSRLSEEDLDKYRESGWELVDYDCSAMHKYHFKRLKQ